jgi:small-conductance mechanosensitive channel
MRFGLRIVWLTLLCLVLGAAAPAPATHSPDADLQASLSQANAEMRAAGAGFRTASLSDQEIKSRLAALGPIETRLATVLSDIAPRLQDAQARLSQLGPPPPKGQHEDPKTADLRRRIGGAVTIFEDDQRQANLLVLEGQQITDVLTERLRENFEARLSSQSRSIFDPALWRMVAGSAAGDASRLSDFAADETAALLDQTGTPRDVGILAAALVAALILLLPLRIFLSRLSLRRAGRDAGHAALTRSLLALWRVAVGTLTPLAATLILRAALINAQALTETAETAADLAVRAITFGAFIEALGRAVLSPRQGDWRLAPIPDDVARRLALFPALIGFAAGLATFVAGFDAAIGLSLGAQVMVDTAAVVLEIGAVSGALVALGQARVAHLATAKASGDSRLVWILVALAAWLSVATAIGATLIGYLAFAGFLMRETIWVGAVLGLLFLTLRLADEAIPALLSPRRTLGAALETGLGLTAAAVDQIAVLTSGVVRVVLFVFAWAAMVAPFGASAGEIFGRVTSTAFVLHLGKVAISPGAVFGAIALFFIGLFLTRGVRRWLERRYLPKTHLDMGVRTSLATGVTYLGGAIAILTAFAYLGLSFSQIALFASALSVGIGFGLQSIIGNFVSGLILLAERPVRVGDWIAIGDLEGDVRKISVRATEIEMADRSRLIVPNSDLISKTVRNVTHATATGRVRILLKVSDDADPVKVRDLLLNRLKGHEGVLKDPAPGVYLTNAGEGALEFTCMAYLSSPRDAFRVKSELLFQIVPDLRAEGIALANSTPVVNVGLGERQIEPRPPLAVDAETSG